MFRFPVKRKRVEERETDTNEQHEDTQAKSSEIVVQNCGFVTGAQAEPEQCCVSVVNECNQNDIGHFIDRASLLPAETKRELLENCWMPPKTYNFAEDAVNLKRKFNFSWLETYSPWLVYSRRQKGAFCKYCALFPPNVSSFRGVLGSFIVKPFCKFKDIHDQCKKHAETHIHKAAIESARSFMQGLPVDVQLNNYSQKQISENRKIITSIISCITFCGAHDLALRGKNHGEGILEDLFKLRIDSGDTVLKSHIEHGKKMRVIVLLKFKTK